MPEAFLKRHLILALIELSAGVTAAKVGDVKRRGGMFGVVSLYLPYLEHNDAPKTTQRKSVVIGAFSLERHCCLDMKAKGKTPAVSARSHNPEHSVLPFDVTHFRYS